MTFNIIWQSLKASTQLLSLTFLEVDNGGIMVLLIIHYVIIEKIMSPQKSDEIL